jgi:hypothetical protein
MTMALLTTSSLLLSYSNVLGFAQSVSLPPKIVPHNNNNNNNNDNDNIQVTDVRLTTGLTPAFLSGSASTVFPFVPIATTVINPGIIATTSSGAIIANPFLLTANQIANPFLLTANQIANPFLLTANQIPFVQGSSTNGFVSFLCSSNTVQTPSPSALIFQATSGFASVNPLLFPTLNTATITTATTTTSTIPITGTITLFNSLGGPNLSGQIDSGQVIGNSFTLQGVLTNGNLANTLSGTVGGFCNTLGSGTTIPLLSTFGNQFTIAGTCGTNVPVSFTIDRILIGAYAANVSCNGIT